jgi:hypothetical protein
MNKIKIWFETLNHERKKNIAIAGCLFLISAIWSYINYGLYPNGSFFGFYFGTFVIPGWHTIFSPISFTTGWLFSALVTIVMIITLLLIVFRKIKVINIEIIEILNIILFILGLIISICYLSELIICFNFGYFYEQIVFNNRVLGSIWWFDMLNFCLSIILPLFFGFKKIRKNLWSTLILCFLLKISILLPLYKIYATTIARDYLPSSWSYEYANESNYKLLFLLISIALLVRLIFIISKKE